MDRFVFKINPVSPSTVSGNLTPPPSPAGPPPAKKGKSDGVKVSSPKRNTSVDWRSRVTLNDEGIIGFENSQGEFETLAIEGPPTPSFSTDQANSTPSRKTESMLAAVQQGIFQLLAKDHPMIEFNCDTMESTTQYKDLMVGWNKHFNKYQSTDAWKAAAPPDFNASYRNQALGVKFQDGRLAYTIKKKEDKLSWSGAMSKCKTENCWNKSQLGCNCRAHTTINREVLFIRDVANQDKVNVALITPQVRNDSFTDVLVNETIRGTWYERTSLAKYLTERPDAWFVIEKSWEYNAEICMTKFQTLEILFSLITTLHNDVTRVSSSMIHFINGDVNVENRQMEEVNKGLQLNGMGFEIGDDNNSLCLNKSPHLPIAFDPKLPFVYVGDKKDGGYRFGEDHSQLRQSVVSGSRSHQFDASTTMKGIDCKDRTYVFQADPSAYSEQESCQKSLEVETICHQAVLVAEMMGMKSVYGKDTYNIAKKYTHWDGGWDERIFKDIIIMMTGKDIVVKKKSLETIPKEVKLMVPVYKTVGVGKKERKVLDTGKMQKVPVKKKFYDQIVISWI